MKTNPLVTLFSFLLLQSMAFSQNLVPNGNFENDFNSWTQQGTVAISTSVVQSGTKSFMAADSAKLQYSYVWQEFSLDYDSHEINFWVNPASATYFNAFELIANWQTQPPVIFVSRVLFTESIIEFTAVDRRETIANVLTADSWNKITITADKTTLTQKFFINNNLVSTLRPTSFPTIEHLLVGDLSIQGMYGTVFFDEISITDSITTSIDSPLVSIPHQFVLEQNYPNPFNPSTTISYQTTIAGPVTLKIYNTAGQEIKTLINEMQLPGRYSRDWYGTDKNGQRVASGVYLYRLAMNGKVALKKMLMIK